MSISFKGKVINSNYKAPDDAQYGVSVYISDDKGNITKNRIASTTDPSGNYTLIIPVKSVSGIPVPQIDGNFITAKQKTGSVGEKKLILPLSKTVFEYNFDMASLGSSRDIPEITLTAKKPLATEQPPKDNKWLWWLLGGLVIVGVSYAIYKNQNK
jgi:hypothetical protein